MSKSANLSHYLLNKVDEQVSQIFSVCEFGCNVDQCSWQILLNKSWNKNFYLNNKIIQIDCKKIIKTVKKFIIQKRKQQYSDWFTLL